MKNHNEISCQVMDLKDLIAGPLVAAIDADSMATRRYLDYLIELAFDTSQLSSNTVGNLRYLEFSYQSVGPFGIKNQIVRIPLLTLVSLPLLQIKEANFDFEIQVLDATREDGNASFSLKNNSNSSDDKELKRQRGMKLRVTMASESSTNMSSHRQLTSNMKINIKMQQADMPAGLLKLLNMTSNNLLTEEDTQEHS